MRESRSWYRFENQAKDGAEVWLYGVIGLDPWTGEGVTAKDFARELRDITAPRIVLHLNSPGGDAFEGVAIASALREHAAEVTVRVKGIAASAASYIAMAGDRVIMSQGAMMMIHDAHGVTLGNAEDHRKTAELLDKISDNIAGFYARHAGGSVREWRSRMEEETWFDAEEAVKLGLADEISEEVAPQNIFDLRRFSHVPERLRNEGRRNAGPDRERIQRIHDLTVELEALCGSEDAENHAHLPATTQEPQIASAVGATVQEPKYGLTPLLARLETELIEAGMT